MSKPDPHGLTSEPRAHTTAETPIDRAMAEAATALERALPAEGVHAFRYVLLVDDLTDDVSEDTPAGLLARLAPDDDARDLLAILLTHLVAIARTNDIPVAQVAANVLFGATPHHAVTIEELSDIPDGMRALTAGVSDALENHDHLPEGAHDVTERTMLGHLFEFLSTMTFTPMVQEMLARARGEGVPEGDPPADWPTGVPWGRA